MQNPQTVEAAGAVLSQKNTIQIKSAWQALTELLLASGNLSFDDIPKELIGAQHVYDALKKKEIGASGRLLDSVNRETWQLRLRAVIDHFYVLFCASACNPENAKDPKGEISSLLSDFIAIAKDLAANPPAESNSTTERRIEDRAVFASDRQSDTPVVPEAEVPQVSELERLFQESVAIEEESSETEVQATEGEGSEGDETLVLQIEARAGFDASATNERLVEGVLFVADSPSEAIPNVGPGLPLYIPRHVAVEALQCLDSNKPKPLDAHDTLSEHASTKIVGAMTSARIDGNDFWVSGVLWDYNQPEKVEAISASQDSLGMSVNATAEGHPATVGGRSVWQIDRLRILGANLLFSEKATFKKTRISVLASSDLELFVPVLASARDLAGDLEIETPILDIPEITMDTLAISAQIRELSDSVAAMHAEANKRLNAIEPLVRSLSNQMDEIQAAARTAKDREIQAEAMKAEQEKQAQLIEAMKQAVEERLGPASRGGPKYPGRVLPLAASGSTPTSGSMEIQLELASLDGEIRAMDRDPHADMAKILELMDRRKALQAQVAGFPRE